MKKLISILLALVLLTGCAAHPAPEAGAIAEPSYPSMAPYPNETDFIDPATGIFDDEGFRVLYDAWREGQQARYSVPQGYADSLKDYFTRSIPAFLKAGKGNAVCSPLNVYIALAMLAEVTEGDSRQEILTLLGADSAEALRVQASQVWNAHYLDDGASTSILANSLWLDQGLSYDTDTVNLLAQDYYASVFQGDLGSRETNELLQTWLDEQTGGLLKEQTQNVTLDPQTVLALASTLYYRAKWTDEFNPANTASDIFHTPQGDVTADFMKRQITYGHYYWGEDFGAVFLRLEDGSKLWLILPDDGILPEDLLESGHALDLVLNFTAEYENQKGLKINLSLPKFDTSSDLRLEAALKELGIAAVFAAGADFTPILPEQEAWLDSVNHAARVKVDEEGVEAAAYTVMAMCGAAMPPEEEMDFILDRPFLFAITDRDNLPLFAGIVNTP